MTFILNRTNVHMHSGFIFLGTLFLSGGSIKIHLKALKSSFFYFGYKLNNLSKDLLNYFLVIFLVLCFPGWKNVETSNH